MSIISQRVYPPSRTSLSLQEQKFRNALMPMSLGKLETMLENLAAAIDPKHLDANQQRTLQRISLTFLDTVGKKQLTDELKRHKAWEIFQNHLSVIQLIQANIDRPQTSLSDGLT